MRWHDRCANCGHIANNHVAGRGMCSSCKCEEFKVKKTK